MSHLYTSLAVALKVNKTFLIYSSIEFRALIKETATPSEINESDETYRFIKFALRESARKMYGLRRKTILNRTGKTELSIMREALYFPWIHFRCPITHLVPRALDGVTWGDSCLRATGGWSNDYRFWWHHKCPESIKNRTLLVLFDNSTGKLISINAMEYTTIIIHYAAVCADVIPQITDSNPYPNTLIVADNKSAESWTKKGCRVSLPVRALGRLHYAHMINNHVGINVDYVNTKENIIAGEISRVDHAVDDASFL